jgi:3-oxoadipate enol-lactonase
VKRTAKLNGIEIFCSDVGDHGRNVLLIHGHPFNHTMWRPQTEYLQENHRVLVPDLRGYGKSSLPENARETTLETFAADNLALMDFLEVREFVLGGLSMGGQIILEMYRQAPHRIRALLLADTFAGLDSAERKQWRFTTADRLEREGMAPSPRKSSPR